MQTSQVNMQQHFYFPLIILTYLDQDSSDEMKDIKYNLDFSLSLYLGTFRTSLITIKNCNNLQSVHLWPPNVVG